MDYCIATEGAKLVVAEYQEKILLGHVTETDRHVMAFTLHYLKNELLSETDFSEYMSQLAADGFKAEEFLI